MRFEQSSEGNTAGLMAHLDILNWKHTYLSNTKHLLMASRAKTLLYIFFLDFFTEPETMHHGFPMSADLSR